MILGLDTSYWDDNPADPRMIDWIKAAKADVKFVVMRATLGTVIKDSIYLQHKKALEGVLPRGSYHYLRTGSTPADQAKFYFDYAGKLELPPCLDVEDYSYHELPKGEALFTLIQKTLGYIDQYFGQKCMLYTGPDIIKNYLGYEWAQKLTDRKLWIAHYGVSTPDIRPWTKYTFWQFSDTVPAAQYGITEAKAVDGNYYPGTIDEFNNEFGLEKEEPIPMSDTIYKSYAHLPNVGKGNVISPDAKYPGYVIDGYDGKNYQTAGQACDPMCATHIGVVGSLNVPAIISFSFFFDTTEPWVGLPALNQAGNYEEWNMSVLDKLVFQDLPNKVKRKISGIILDMRQVKMTNGHVVTPGNWNKITQWFYDACWSRYHIDLFLMPPSQTIIDTLMGGDPGGQISTLVSSLNSHCSVSAKGPFASGQFDAYGLPYPADGWKPDWYVAKRVWMSFYGAGYTVADISGPVNLWQYDKKVADMLAELGFSGGVTPTPDPTPTPEPTPADNIDLSGVNAQLSTIIANQATILAAVNRTRTIN